jgi:hypothetical protein
LRNIRIVATFSRNCSKAMCAPVVTELDFVDLHRQQRRWRFTAIAVNPSILGIPAKKVMPAS